MNQYARPGERNGRSKLTVEQVEAIRNAVRQRDHFLAESRRLREEAKRLGALAKAIKNRDIAERVGLTERALCMMLYGHSWKHLR